MGHGTLGGVCFTAGIILLFSCQPQSSHYMYLEGHAQGTTFRITYRDSLLRDFSSSVDSLFRVIDASMSLWDSTSIISRINRNDTTAMADIHFTLVFNKAREVSKETQGSFDITVGPLVNLWGFGVNTSMPIPDSTQVDSVKQCCGYQKVQLIDGRISKDIACLQVDMNALAKGYTVDLLTVFLASKGIEHSMVEIGGEVRTLGQNARGVKWRVGIDDPSGDTEKGRRLQTAVELDGKALATSGNYRHYVEAGGEKLGHILDPATGYPARQKVVSVSVMADDCMTADAYATAFMVMGAEKAMETAQRLGLEIYCLYPDDEGRMQVAATAGFMK